MGERFFSELFNYIYTIAVGGKEAAMQKAIADGLSVIEQKFTSKIEGVQLDAKDFSPFGAISYWNQITKSIMDVNQGLGIGGKLGQNIQASFRASLFDARELGATAEDIAKEFKAFTEELGRNRQLTSQELVDLVEYQQLFGESASEVFATYSQLGVSFSQITEDIQQIAIDSGKIGVNYSKVMDVIKKNLSAVNRLTFNKGRMGMMEMAKYAVKTNLSMESAVAFAENIWEGGIEGSIEMGANLQMLGGEMASLGDPFELFYLARNAPEELMERLGDATKNLATFNAETGEIDINALGMSRLRELAKATGVDLTELTKTAKTFGKEAEIERRFDFSVQTRGDFDDILSKVAGISEFDKDINDWVVKLGEETKRVSDLTPEMISELDFTGAEEAKDVNERIIKSNETLSETMQRLIDQMKLGFLGGVAENYDRVYEITRNLADNVRGMMTGEGGLKSAMDAFKDLSKGTYDNLMDMYEDMSKGDFSKAFKRGFDNLSGVFKEVGAFLGQTLWTIFRLTGGLFQYMAQYIGATIQTGVLDIGNKILVNLGMSPMPNDVKYPDAKDIYKEPLKDYMDNVLPEFFKSGDFNMKGMMEDVQKDLSEIEGSTSYISKPISSPEDLESKTKINEGNIGQTMIKESSDGSVTAVDIKLVPTGGRIPIQRDGGGEYLRMEDLFRVLKANGIDEPKTGAG